MGAQFPTVLMSNFFTFNTKRCFYAFRLAKSSLKQKQAPTCVIYIYVCVCVCVFLWCCGSTRAMASSFLRFLDHSQWRITVGRTPLDEWSARSRDLYLTTHNTHNRQTSMPPVEFEPTISAGERPQTFTLDRAATGTGCVVYSKGQCMSVYFWNLLPRTLVNSCRHDERYARSNFPRNSYIIVILKAKALNISKRQYLY